jgi:hypothetical protein
VIPKPHLRSRSAEAAALAFDLSAQHCGACKAYHSAWPYLRLVDPPRGVDADRTRLLAVLGPLLRDGSSVLLAGSADAGLAECVLDAAEPHEISLDVVDLCETPLCQCVELLSGRVAGRLRTWQASIAGAPVTAPVDVIVAHSVLSFLPQEELAAAAAFVRNSLKEMGYLVMTIGLWDAGGQPKDPALLRRHVVAALAAQSVPLPTDEDAFSNLLEAYARGRAERSSPFSSREEVMTWLESAGLVPVCDENAPRGSSNIGDGQQDVRSGRGLLVVARKRST